MWEQTARRFERLLELIFDSTCDRFRHRLHSKDYDRSVASMTYITISTRDQMADQEDELLKRFNALKQGARYLLFCDYILSLNHSKKESPDDSDLHARLNRLLGKTDSALQTSIPLEKKVDPVDDLIARVSHEITLEPDISTNAADTVDQIIRRALEENALESKYSNINTTTSTSDPGPPPKPFTLDEVHDETANWCCKNPFLHS